MSHLTIINLKRKKKQLLSVGITLPILTFGVGQAVTSAELINQEEFQLSTLLPIPTVSISQAKLNSNTSETFYPAARGDRTKKCNWLGICDQKE
ncbi:MAG: hypothetical protein F6K47_05920 [Symploca sp. SIO2E6]|nr:hypothetical protein [Symploca sp. SIO2E6]